jgi:hypothetical protein
MTQIFQDRSTQEFTDVELITIRLGAMGEFEGV